MTTYYLYDEDGGPMPLVEETASGATPTYTEAYGVGADGVRARYQPGNQYTVYQWYGRRGSIHPAAASPACPLGAAV